MYTAGCWEFTGSRDRLGYGWVGVGSMKTGDRRMAATHRVVYEALEGPIPEGLHLDHLCRNPACVNPLHLEPIDGVENRRRGAKQGIKPGQPWSPLRRQRFEDKRWQEAQSTSR